MNMLELEQLKKLGLYLVEASGDGSRNAKLAVGKDDARRKLCELMWFGSYEEAQEDEMIAGILKEFDDPENYWSDDGTVYSEKGEQCWWRVSLITEIPNVLDDFLRPEHKNMKSMKEVLERFRWRQDECKGEWVTRIASMTDKELMAADSILSEMEIDDKGK